MRTDLNSSIEEIRIFKRRKSFSLLTFYGNLKLSFLRGSSSFIIRNYLLDGRMAVIILGLMLTEESPSGSKSSSHLEINWWQVVVMGVTSKCNASSSWQAVSTPATEVTMIKIRHMILRRFSDVCWKKPILDCSSDFALRGNDFHFLC